MKRHEGARAHESAKAHEVADANEGATRGLTQRPQSTQRLRDEFLEFGTRERKRLRTWRGETMSEERLLFTVY